tara:strand:+ start:1328 stop:1516 length:189 start_codon:yes stop_codon:yes gene_type:complete
LHLGRRLLVLREVQLVQHELLVPEAAVVEGPLRQIGGHSASVLVNGSVSASSFPFLRVKKNS